MLFFCGPSGIQDRFVDVSQQAIVTPHLPYSVGVRSQALKLRFATPDTRGRFLQTKQPFQEMRSTFEHRFGREFPKPLLHTAHIGENLSLIYSPFYVKDKIYDAILDQPVSKDLPGNFNFEDFPEDSPHEHIQFVSTLCPRCGWDLEGERDAVVLRCQNCNSVWYPVGKKLKQLKFAHLPGKQADMVCLPFWRISAEIAGLTLTSCADLMKIANVPRVARSEREDLPFRFWIPAFKLRPRVFLRVASHMTFAQPHENLVVELPKTRILASTLAVEEATESLKVTLASFLRPQKTLMEKLPDIQIEAKGFTLVYIPFKEEHLELIQPDFQLAINKNIMAHSKNL